ncbi:MFS transporter [Coraliomargarita sp. SDUM461004]|uniref:MFS transporter n=1 Tax=Thalassobacterium sedimentorum TaxID=3041258 RepID=A0ABU1AGB1_9BACT|nr:MFS transporter [Coraliomargarita sp. SDUM461004]MDQ8193869.1 MFS transporter [Coraliomargarita sp. SDUM461004]
MPTTSNDSTSKKLSVREKAAWGCGGFSDQLAANGLNNIFVPIFNIGLGLSSVLIGWAVSIPRFVDMISDPLMGNISDNSRSRFGRRRPLIFLGSILMALGFGVSYMASPYWGDWQLFSYALVSCIFFYLMYTVYSVPYNALGLELAEDYDDRADLQKYRLLASSFASFTIPWLYKLCILAGEHIQAVILSEKTVWYGSLLAPVSEMILADDVKLEVIGARYVAWGIALMIVLTALPAVLFTKEKLTLTSVPKVSFFNSGVLAVKNRSFRTLCCMIFLVITGMYFIGVLVTYANIFYVFDGDRSTAATWTGLYGTVTGITGMVSSFLIPVLVKRFDKKRVLMFGLLLAVVSISSSWFLLNPALPQLQLLMAAMVSFGMSACWLLNGAFIADICDEDELLNGYRQEGMFAAFFGFVVKMAFSGIALLLGLVLWLIGYEAGAELMSEQTILRMRLFIAVFPPICLVGAFWVFRNYRLNRQVIYEIQHELKKRKAMESA